MTTAQSVEGPWPTLLAQNHIRFDIPDSRQRHDSASQNALEIRKIPGNDPETEIVETKHMLYSLDFRNCGNRALEFLKPCPAFRGKFDTEEHNHPEAQTFEVQIDPMAPDGPCPLKSADTPPSRRLAKPETPSQRARRKRGVFHQCTKKAPVNFVKYTYIGNRSCSFTIATCINASMSEI